MSQVVSQVKRVHIRRPPQLRALVRGQAVKTSQTRLRARPVGQQQSCKEQTPYKSALLSSLPADQSTLLCCVPQVQLSLGFNCKYKVQLWPA
jgi:hypothetical protein